MPISDNAKANSNHAVPQNFMDVEFKLVGDLTMRQFTYLLVFGGLAYFTSVGVGGIFKWPLTAFFVLLGLVLAFVPIEERGMDQWIVNFIKAIYSPTDKIWKKEAVLPSVFLYQNLAVVRQELITLAPTSSRRKLEEYLENQGQAKKIDRLDFQENYFTSKLREVYGDGSSQFSTSQSYAPTVTVTTIPETSVEIEPDLPLTPTEEEPQKPPEIDTLQDQVSQLQPTEETIAVVPQVIIKSHIEHVTKAVVAPPIISKEIAPKIIRPQYHPMNLSPMTPDRHSGRRFTSLLPNQGEIILPIRGERVLKTSAEINIEDDIEDKADQLKRLMEQIKAGESVARPVSKPVTKLPTSVKKEDISVEAEKVVEGFKSENQKLSSEIEKLREEVAKSKATTAPNILQEKESELQKLEKTREKSTSEVQALQQQLDELKKKLDERARISPNSSQIKTTISNDIASLSKLPPVDKPNILQGIVKNPRGLALEGVLLIIKNSRGEPVRAVKTNSLGQFVLNTPLATGTYTIEVTGSGFSFDIISVDAHGQLLSAIELVGKS